MTNGTQPAIIGTLAADAETGQFPKAVEKANVARNLVLITEQRAMAAKNARRISLYSAGMTANAAGNP
jgi:hypothetical protein